MASFLDFEKPIAELQGRIDQLRETAADGAVDIDSEVGRLQAKSDKLLRDTYAKLTPWQKTQVARHGERPHFGDYVAGLFDDFMPHLIARLAYELHIDLIEKLRLEGINVTRWRILAVLSMGDGITINEIIERAMMQQSALSRALMKMEAEDFVRRVSRRDDARYVEVFITDKGRSLFDSLDRVVRSRQKTLLKGFSQAETDTAFDLLRRMSRNITHP